MILDWALAALIPALISVHATIAPYTKVEESFNIQAIHDILTYGVPSQNTTEFFRASYDHVDFPGSVPRTFVGAVVLSGLARPWVGWLSSPEQLQMLVRGILGLINGLALVYFRHAVDTAYGRVAGRWYLVLQACQFHVMFYASRTLPNMLAFPLTTMAMRNLILSNSVPPTSDTGSKRRRLALYLLTIAGVVFRSEIAVLLAAQVMNLALKKRAFLTKEIIPAGVFGLVVGLAATVTIDSFFWQRFPLWPELEGFYYNTVLGKSAEWGTSPFYYYFLNTLPRLLLNPVTWAICMPLALNNKALQLPTQDILAPLYMFVAAYSFLPHKEWRFIVYIVPSLTAVAAGGAAWIWTRRTKALLYRLLSLLLVGSTLASFAASLGLLYLSSYNYPGGEALSRLHGLSIADHGIINVHLDNLACQTGVTRFLQKPQLATLNPGVGEVWWKYDKTEDETELLNPLFWQRFDYVLAEDPKRVIGSWEVVGTVYGYAGIGLKSSDVIPIPPPGLTFRQGQLYSQAADFMRTKITSGHWPTVKMEPKIYILKRES